MALAVDVAARCSCRKSVVGAVITRDGRIVSTGYNGTIVGFANCIDGGCPRCADPNVESGTLLDRCICVHAEANALLAAARFGHAVEGAEIWVTTEPCLECTKLLIQSRVGKVVFWRRYPLKPELEGLRLDMRRHAAAQHDHPVLFEQWTPDSNVLGLDERYQAIGNRLQAYVDAQTAELHANPQAGETGQTG